MIEVLLDHRRWLIALFQMCLVAAAYQGAFLLCFEGAPPPDQWDNFYRTLPAIITIKMVIFWRFGLLRGWWRYVSMADLYSLFKANLFASLVFVLYVVFVHGIPGYSRAVFFLDGVLCFLALGAPRFALRAYREGFLPVRQLRGQRVLIIGAGIAGQAVARELRQSPNLEKAPIGFLDDNPDKIGHTFQGVCVLGPVSSLSQLVERHGVEVVIIAIPSATGRQMRTILAECHKSKVELVTLPGLEDLIEGNVTISQLRKARLEDLLGRNPVRINCETIASDLAGQVVLVTGAGGSIGTEICRQVAAFRPRALVLFEQNEFNLYSIQMELSKRFPDLHSIPVIGDVQDRNRVELIMDLYGPSVIYHAAAYKHVPMMELNPLEAVKNNVAGTRAVAEAAARHGVKKFALISTDKAVRPAGVMGATKRAAERVLDAIDPGRTAFVTVRFGNVLGSSGSVIPLFEKQIAEGGPVTVTHPHVTRYFMMIPEAVALVLQAGSMGRGGEIFLLEMGEPVKIIDLARNMIRLSGLEPGEDIEIRFTGLRPGEKLCEELLADGEEMEPTDHEHIFVVRTKPAQDGLCEKLDSLIGAAKSGQTAVALSCLRDVVEPYYPEFDNLGRLKRVQCDREVEVTTRAAAAVGSA